MRPTTPQLEVAAPTAAESVRPQPTPKKEAEHATSLLEQEEEEEENANVPLVTKRARPTAAHAKPYKHRELYHADENAIVRERYTGDEEEEVPPQMRIRSIATRLLRVG